MSESELDKDNLMHLYSTSINVPLVLVFLSDVQVLLFTSNLVFLRQFENWLSLMSRTPNLHIKILLSSVTPESKYFLFCQQSI